MQVFCVGTSLTGTLQVPLHCLGTFFPTGALRVPCLDIFPIGTLAGTCVLNHKLNRYFAGIFRARQGFSRYVATSPPNRKQLHMFGRSEKSHTPLDDVVGFGMPHEGG